MQIFKDYNETMEQAGRPYQLHLNREANGAAASAAGPTAIHENDDGGPA